MDINELFKKAFNVNLPISGGMGNSIDNPVIIHSDGMLNDYVQTEYAVMDFMAIGREMEWKLIKQEFISHGNKKIDRLTVEVKGIGNNIMPLQHEFMYFDITEVFGNQINMLSDVIEAIQSADAIAFFARAGIRITNGLAIFNSKIPNVDGIIELGKDLLNFEYNRLNFFTSKK